MPRSPSFGRRRHVVSKGFGLYLVFVGWSLIGLDGLFELPRPISALGGVLFLLGGLAFIRAHRR